MFATSQRQKSVGIHIVRRMQTKYYLYIAFVAGLSLFLPVTLCLAATQVEQFPTCKHKIWVILFIDKQCEDLKNHKLKCLGYVIVDAERAIT